MERHRAWRTLFNPRASRARYLLYRRLATYARRADKLDTVSVHDHAKRFGVSDRAIERILIPLTEGLFFLRPERYSSYVLFGLLAQGAIGIHRSGLAAFSGE